MPKQLLLFGAGLIAGSVGILAFRKPRKIYMMYDAPRPRKLYRNNNN